MIGIVNIIVFLRSFLTKQKISHFKTLQGKLAMLDCFPVYVKVLIVLNNFNALFYLICLEI